MKPTTEDKPEPGSLHPVVRRRWMRFRVHLEGQRDWLIHADGYRMAQKYGLRRYNCINWVALDEPPNAKAEPLTPDTSMAGTENMSEPKPIESETRGGSCAPAPCSAWRPAAEYKSNCEAWWKGRRVRLMRVLRTRGGAIYRKGRIVRVTRKLGGLTLEGRKMRATRVGYWGIDVDITPNDQAERPPLETRSSRV